MDILKCELGSSNKTCVTSTVDGNVIGLRAESISNMTEEEDQVPRTVPVIKTEPKNCMDFLECETDYCPETFVTCHVDGFEEVSIKDEEAIGMKDEIPEATSFPPIETEHENCMDLLKGEPGSSNETCVSCAVNGNEENDIEAEMVCNMTEEEEGLPRTVPVIKTEPEICMDFVEGETGFCSETCDVDGLKEVSIKVQEAIDIKDEIPEATSFPPIKTEHEVTLNEEVHVNSAECGSSCDIHSFDHPYTCAVCNKTFSRKSTLIKHQSIHNGDHPYGCAVCNKAFSQKGNLITHQRIHSGDHPYSCALCNKVFSRKSTLILHGRIHSGDHPYSCDVCNKAFSQKGNLITHQRIHSGDFPYNCDVCNKAFSNKSNLIRHRRIHSGDHPYSCDVCNKVFNHKSSLIRHQLIHSGDRPYSCAVCNKGFRQQSSLIKHQRIHSGDRC